MTDEIWKRDEIASPCVNLCTIHPAERICIGCYRSIDEITEWSRYTPERRAELMEELPNRASRLKKRRGGRKGR
ncbi:DUF1289 domain-containing protein [Actibacterium mucosum]|uniref:DUF1289 domain-containing protein n=1 Tax=Actibacterium mucosum TaxID=1087332 RepID=UPI0005559ED0|nr:DUF1289 domain-containing protein [Actibacterium mucosum]